MMDYLGPIILRSLWIFFHGLHLALGLSCKLLFWLRALQHFQNYTMFSRRVVLPKLVTTLLFHLHHVGNIFCAIGSKKKSEKNQKRSSQLL